MLSRALATEILRLHATEHWPVGTIATQLRVHHDTVRRVLTQAGVPTQKSVRACMVEPYLAFIHETLAKYPTLRASRLYAMVRERGYLGAPDHFRAIVARLRPRPAGEAYLRLRTLPVSAPSPRPPWLRRSPSGGSLLRCRAIRYPSERSDPWCPP